MIAEQKAARQRVLKRMQEDAARLRKHAAFELDQMIGLVKVAGELQASALKLVMEANAMDELAAALAKGDQS